MTDKPEPKDANAKEPRPIIHLGKIGDGTEEKNLGERGEPALPRRWEITPLSIVVKGEKCAATNHDFGRGDTLQTTCGAR